jgi:FkbM family methyltransferase
MISSLYKQGIRPKTVIDVGANIGQFSVAAANIFSDSKVYAFEPNPECRAKLRANTSKCSDIDIRHMAVGNKNGKANFYINSFDQASSLLKMNSTFLEEFSKTREKDAIRVDIATLDDIFLDRTLDRPVLLKIDVQGSEKDVIAGGQETLKNVDYVLMEVSFDTMYVGEASFLEIVKEMETLHFQFSHPIAILKSPNSGKILQADILFVNTNPIVA